MQRRTTPTATVPGAPALMPIKVFAGALVLSASLARTLPARAVGLGLAAAAPAAAGPTRATVASLLAIAAPVVLGYVRRDLLASAIQIVSGAAYAFASFASSAPHPGHVREIQRPLEGYAGPSVIPDAEL